MHLSMTRALGVLLVSALFLACGSNSPPPAMPAITDINGGLSASGTVGSLFVIDGTGFGDLAAATPGYSIDFRDATTSAVVASATVDYAVGAWKNLFITATVPSTLVASTTYKVTVTTPSGTSLPVSFLVVGSITFSPSTISWAATSSLPVALQGLSTVVSAVGGTTYVYALGGNTAASTTQNGKASNVSTVYMNSFNGNTSALAGPSWALTGALPAARGFAAAVAATAFNSKLGGNGAIYLLGGLDAAGAATSTVWAASLDADGTIPASGSGAWTATTSLPQPLFAHAAVIFHGRIYVAGGNDSTGTPVATVYSAPINADGSLGSWVAAPGLPDKRAYHQILAIAGNLYVLGGSDAAADPLSNVLSAGSQSTVYYDPINLQNGSLANATWTTNANTMTKPREKGSAVAAGGYVLVSGGLYNGAATGSSEQSYASLNADGSLSAFNGATGVHTITGSAGGYNFFNQSTAFFVDAAGRPHVFILGGADVNTGAAHAEVWYQP